MPLVHFVFIFFIDIEACRKFKQKEVKDTIAKLKFQICNLQSLRAGGGSALELVSKEDVEKLQSKLKKEQNYLFDDVDRTLLFGLQQLPTSPV